MRKYRLSKYRADKLNPQCNGCAHKNFVSFMGMFACCDYSVHYGKSRCVEKGQFIHYGGKCPYKESKLEYLTRKAKEETQDCPQPTPEQHTDGRGKYPRTLAKYHAKVRGVEATGTIYEIADQFHVAVSTVRRWADPTRNPPYAFVQRLPDEPKGGDNQNDHPGN